MPRRFLPTVLGAEQAIDPQQPLKHAHPPEIASVEYSRVPIGGIDGSRWLY